MHKIVFQNPDGQPKPAMEHTYTSIISASISGIKCATHDKSVEFNLVFKSPDTYLIEINACCDEFKAIIDHRVAQMLS